MSQFNDFQSLKSHFKEVYPKKKKKSNKKAKYKVLEDIKKGKK